MDVRRRLVLRRELLTELDGAELRGVAGGTHIVTDCGCLTHGYSCDVCEVPSLPVNTCLCGSLADVLCWASPRTVLGAC